MLGQPLMAHRAKVRSAVAGAGPILSHDDASRDGDCDDHDPTD